MFKKMQYDKIGNLLIYLSKNINKLTMTKALKMLYIIDETAVKEVGSPITWLKYKVWEKGPVAETIYTAIRNLAINKAEAGDFREYITVKQEQNKHSNYSELMVEPIKEFDDSEFSDYEIELADRIIKNYGNKKANSLVKMLHDENTLWSKIVESENLKSSFELYNKKSNFNIELSELIKDDTQKFVAYKAAYDSMHFNSALNE